MVDQLQDVINYSTVRWTVGKKVDFVSSHRGDTLMDNILPVARGLQVTQKR